MNKETIYNIFIEIINQILLEEGETNENDNLLPLLDRYAEVRTPNQEL